MFSPPWNLQHLWPSPCTEYTGVDPWCGSWVCCPLNACREITHLKNREMVFALGLLANAEKCCESVRQYLKGIRVWTSRAAGFSGKRPKQEPLPSCRSCSEDSPGKEQGDGRSPQSRAGIWPMELLLQSWLFRKLQCRLPGSHADPVNKPLPWWMTSSWFCLEAERVRPKPLVWGIRSLHWLAPIQEAAALWPAGVSVTSSLPGASQQGWLDFCAPCRDYLTLIWKRVWRSTGKINTTSLFSETRMSVWQRCLQPSRLMSSSGAARGGSAPPAWHRGEARCVEASPAREAPQPAWRWAAVAQMPTLGSIFSKDWMKLLFLLWLFFCCSTRYFYSIVFCVFFLLQSEIILW